MKVKKKEKSRSQSFAEPAQKKLTSSSFIFYHGPSILWFLSLQNVQSNPGKRKKKSDSKKKGKFSFLLNNNLSCRAPTENTFWSPKIWTSRIFFENNGETIYRPGERLGFSCFQRERPFVPLLMFHQNYSRESIFRKRERIYSPER